MRIFLDACVLYPTVMRELIEDTAAAGLITPLWSPRVLEEWRRAALRGGSDAGPEIALLRNRFPDAEVSPEPAFQATLSLPDKDDTHVLAAAVAGAAEALCTFNIRDFPMRTLGRHGLIRMHPDELMASLHAEDPATVAHIAEGARARAARAFGREIEMRALMKKCGLPRFGKALG